MFNPFLFVLLYIIVQVIYWRIKMKKFPDWRNDDEFVRKLCNYIHINIGFMIGFLLGYYTYIWI